ncbi:(2Fe-2S)-binding protein [Ancylobacter sp. TS-1]|nr:(2Fe-2S)-binding protein [Ancylobacter sp. TS-1]QFR34961.1 (2Fe-2S)-binding protein [Ancylobacter sp. TS-1]
MIVCSCNVLSDRQIRDAMTETQAPVRSVGQVYRCLGCSAQCGRCARTIRKLIDDVNAASCGGCARDCPVAAHAHSDHAHTHTHAAPVHAIAAE